MMTIRGSKLTISATSRGREVIIHHSGRDFIVSETMGEFFHRRSREVLASGHAELVPLLHSEGVELLLVGLSVENVSA